MAAFLYRLGRLPFRHRLLFVLMWVVVLAGVGVAAGRAPAAPPNDMSVPGTESQQANDLLSKSFPGSNPNGAFAQIVFVAPPGQQITSPRDAAVIGQVVARAAATPQAATVVNPFQGHLVSRDRSTAIATITYKVVSTDLTAATTNALQGAARQGQKAGLTVQIGSTALTPPVTNAKGVTISVVIAAVVLLVTFGSLAAAGLPLLTAGIGVGISVGSIVALGSALGLSSTTRTLALMLGLAVGIDYALFIVSRYREEHAQGREPREAAALAVGTAGTAVVFAGLTVVITLAGLSVVGIPLLTKMGLTAAAAVVVAVLVAVTLIPALLGCFPRAAAQRRTRAGAGRARGEGMGGRWSAFVLRRPVVTLLLAVAALGIVALPATRLRLGNSGNATLPTSTTQRQSYDDISRAFGPGYNGPLTIVVTASGAADPRAAADRVAARIAAMPGVASVSRPQLGATGGVARFTAVPATAPDTQRTTSLVQAIRARRPAIASAAGASFLVTGITAVNIDLAQRIQGALLPYLGAVVGLAFLLLLMVFRSLLVPLKATLGFVASLLAALGALVAVFQWAWLGRLPGVSATGPVMALIPVFMIGGAFGLAMDYEFFLVSRVREAYTRTAAPDRAVVSAFRHSARVVAAAAAIMTAVFAGFVGDSQTFVKAVGFGMAAAVVLDAFVVRMTIVSAVLALLGDRAWWLPRWLDAALPRLDIEGKGLERGQAAAAGSPGGGEPGEHAAEREPAGGR